MLPYQIFVGNYGYGAIFVVYGYCFMCFKMTCLILFSFYDHILYLLHFLGSDCCYSNFAANKGFDEMFFASIYYLVHCVIGILNSIFFFE